MTARPPADGYVVEFELTEEDLVAFANVGWGHSVLLRFDAGTLRLFAFLAVIVIVPIIGLASGAQDWWEDPRFRHRAIGVVAVALVGLFVFERPLLNYLLRRRIRASRFAGLMAKRQLKLDPAGVQSTTRTMQTMVVWADITKIVVNSAGIVLLHVARRSFLIPRRVFATASDFSAFVQKARKLKRDHAASPAKPALQMDP